MARNRVIYQTEALFVNKQYSGHNTLDIVNGAYSRVPHDIARSASFLSGDFHQIHRVQSANYGFSINRTDVNQFGNLGRIDSIVIESPSVSFDFTYLITNGTNEDKLGISVDPYVEIGATGDESAGSDPTAYGPRCSALSGILANSSGRNYHILTVPEGKDANKPSGDLLGGQAGADQLVANLTGSQILSIGNGFITNYSVNGSVGGLPTASVSVEGLNITSQDAFSSKGSSGTLAGPAINPSDGTMGGLSFTLPQPTQGSTSAAESANQDYVGDVIRPGDIDVLIEGSLLPNIDGAGNKTKAHIQSFSIDMPLGRTALQRVGNSFAFARVIDFPVQVSCSFSALVADMQNKSSLFNELYDTNKHDLKITLNKPTADASSPIGVSGMAQMAYVLKNCTLESESFNSSIGDNKSVDLTFSATVGGASDTENGLFISGRQCGPFSERGTP